MKRHFSIEEEIFINQFVQHLHSLDAMVEWFNDRDYDDKKEVIHNLINMVIQSHPTYDEITKAAEELRLIKSPAAVKLLNPNKPYSKFGYELVGLPERELEKCFELLLVTLSIADNRRRDTACINGCNHWWHKDLSDEAVIEQIRES